MPPQDPALEDIDPATSAAEEDDEGRLPEAPDESGEALPEGRLAFGHAAIEHAVRHAPTSPGVLAWYQTRIEQALAWHEQALAIAREVGDQAAEAFALINLSTPAVEFGDYDLAFARLEAGLAAARAVGETEAASLALHNLGWLAWLRGELQTSQQRSEEALALAQAEGWDWLVPSILVNYGLATADLGDFDRAAALLRQGLELGHARGNLWDVGTALEGLARVCAGTGRAAAGGDALRDRGGAPRRDRLPLFSHRPRLLRAVPDRAPGGTGHGHLHRRLVRRAVHVVASRHGRRARTAD